MIRFKWLSGDVNWQEYGGKWISGKQNNCEFDYWFVIELTNWHDATGEEDQEKYRVELSVVAPERVAKKEWQEAVECCGWEGMEVDDPVAKVEILYDYGIKADAGQWTGNNAHKLLSQAKKEAQITTLLFGFAMDRVQNAMGATGWDFLEGNVLGEYGRKE